MAKAIWNGVTLAESDTVAHVEGNAYFPNASVNHEYLRENDAFGTTFCHWKGFSAYSDVVVDGQVLEAAVWRYDAPYPQAGLIAGHVAFWKGVEVTGGPEGAGFVEPEPSLRDGKTGWEALCWLLRHPPKSTLNAADILAYTDIPGSGIRDAWQEKDVQRYATRYRWTLNDADGTEISLVQAEGAPVSIG
ncbi:MAG: hypothetical protein ACI9JL_002609 [Paracoccaceae bacterium]|jgi:uncharacterized protein (DUF427 family)